MNALVHRISAVGTAGTLALDVDDINAFNVVREARHFDGR